MAAVHTAGIASLHDGPLCQAWPLALDGPVQAGCYRVCIEALSAGRSLGAWSAEYPVQIVVQEGSGGIPLIASRYPVAFDAPIELLGYYLEAGDDILLRQASIFWGSACTHRETREGASGHFVQMDSRGRETRRPWISRYWSCHAR